MNAATIVQRLWNDCSVVRDDGMSYGRLPFGFALGSPPISCS